MFEQVASADAAFLAAVFDTCDVSAIAETVSEDFEFFHDKWGQIARSRSDFVSAKQGACDRQKSGEDFKARRVLEDGSMRVYPLKNVGAFQTGSHRFFKLEAGKPDIPTERARFAHVWRLVDGRWQLVPGP